MKLCCPVDIPFPADGKVWNKEKLNAERYNRLTGVAKLQWPIENM